jgi:hypothetical protein
MKRLLLAVGLTWAVGVAVLLSAGPASSAPGDVTCTGTAPSTVPHDLIVPAGTTCTAFHTSVGHDVIVEKGATLFDQASTVGHDIKAEDPAGIGIGGIAPGPGGSGSVGHDIKIEGTSGAGPGIMGDNYVCNTTIGHDLVVEDSASAAGQWFIGDADPECPGGALFVKHDLNVVDNANMVDVSDNGTHPNPMFIGGIGHDLNVQGNAAGYVVEGNVAGHEATCGPAPNSHDTDGGTNSAPDNDGCT